MPSKQPTRELPFLNWLSLYDPISGRIFPHRRSSLHSAFINALINSGGLLLQAAYRSAIGCRFDETTGAAVRTYC